MSTTTPPMPHDRLDTSLRWLGWIVVALLPVYGWTVYQAPTDSVQGVMLNILSVHPPLA